MTISFEEQLPPTDAAQIAGAEAALGVNFPQPYRRFLSIQNGGRPQPNALPSNDDVGVSSFFGLGLSEYTDLLSVARSFEGRIPPKMFAIADDGCGNLILLNSVTGGVYFWDHELEAEEGEEPTIENLTAVGSDFDSFLSELVPSADDDEEYEVISVETNDELAEQYGIKFEKEEEA